MRTIVWATPNRMVIDSGLRVFDRQVGAVGPGNRIGDCQHSGYVRAWSETGDGEVFAPGVLQESDLKGFGNLIDDRVRRLVARECGHRPTILYFFFHHTRSGQRVVHGALLTEGHEGGHREIARLVGDHPASAGVVSACAEYVSEPARPVVGRRTTLRSALSRRPRTGAA